MKNMKKYIYYPIITLWVFFAFTSCNEEWTDEQYQHYVSFKAPMNYAKGVTDIYIKYRPNGLITYRLPVIMSGSTIKDQKTEVAIAIDSDTLKSINWEYFHNRTDLYYKELLPEYYTLESMTVEIPANQYTGLLDINFMLNNIDLVDKWVLPLTIVESPTNSYIPHPRKNYKKALLHIIPFNDYSGTYQATALNVYAEGNGNKLNLSTREAYVTGENSVFFYMGAIEETRVDRKLFKMEVTFHPDDSFVPEEGSDKIAQGTVTLRAMSDDSRLNFQMIGTPTYTITENMDKERPVMLRRLVTIAGLSYSFEDPNEVPGHTITYKVNGSMSLQRNINTTIPDEEFAIEW